MGARRLNPIDGLRALEGFGRRHGVRVVTLTGSYLLTSIVTLGSIFLLRHQVSAQVLRDFLSLVFITTVASGLEPGTSKALLLSSRGRPPEGVSVEGVLTASAAKALVASVPLGCLWWFTGSHSDPVTILWIVPIVVLGFWATDVRVLLDWQGRHGEAILAKQGGLTLGVATSAALLGFGFGLGWALAAACVARGSWLAVSLRGRWLGSGVRLVRQVPRLLLDPRSLQLSLASAIAALSGSADRLVALHNLSPLSASGYVILYEALSKYWLIPYLAGPIIFARQVRTARSGRVVKFSLLAVAVSGCVLLPAFAVVVLGAPDLVMRVLRTPLGLSSLLFPAAIVMSAAAQVMNADLQARGYTHYVFLCSTAVLALTLALFWSLSSYGLDGLFIAWFCKSSIELVFCGIPDAIHRVRHPARHPRA